ncbi:S8 family serine peptidase [Streptomyces sp. NPDC015346]|uniref:S8 family serine peptidase n=1 Tax=Streptomyces sp. NPDC015346 TaxID=3364954 RepID=UPI003701E7D1
MALWPRPASPRSRRCSRRWNRGWRRTGPRRSGWAPGVSAKTQWPTDVLAVDDYFSQPGRSMSISGTSMATPHVADAAALYLAARPSATPARSATP